MPSTKGFKGKKLLEAINDAMDKMESKYRSAFLAVIEDITKNPELTDIISDIRNGTITTVDAQTLSRINNITLNTYQLTVATRQAYSAGGKVTAKSVGLEGRFNLRNPKAIEAARTLSDELTSALTRTARENIIDIIGDAVSGADSPAETARRIQDEIGLSKPHAQAVKNYRRTLSQTGMNKKQITKQVEQYAKRLLKYRAETIARTEVAIAVNKGQQTFWIQMKDEGAIPPNTMKVWIAEIDFKTCDICYPLNGELAPVDGAWMTANGPYDIPHAHPRCRCTSGLVFPSKVKKDDPLGYEMWLLEKGDFQGHPFRGNQWTRGTATASSAIVASSAEDAYAKSVELQKSLPKEEADALEGYTSGDYVRINDHLRDYDRPSSLMWDKMFPKMSVDEIESKVEALDKTFEKTSVACSEPVEVFRGMALAKGSWASKLQAGDVIEDRGLVSTSHSKKQAQSFSSPSPSDEQIIFTIKLPKGTKMMAGDGAESELILKRGTKMRVSKVDTWKQGTSDDLGYNIELEVVS